MCLVYTSWLPTWTIASDYCLAVDARLLARGQRVGVGVVAGGPEVVAVAGGKVEGIGHDGIPAPCE